MDARDIKQEPREITDGKYLEEIYDLQKKLIEGYIGIEGLPDYPLDVNIKKNQLLIKDFIGRVIEELAEGYESLREVSQLCLKNKNFLTDFIDKDLNQTMNQLQNASEEMADAMHFMVELLIYSNIQPEDINAYINKGLKSSKDENALHEFIDNPNVLEKAMQFGYVLYNEYLKATIPGMNSKYLNLIKVYKREREDNPEKINQMDERLITCGHYFHPDLYNGLKLVFWDVTYHLNIARNYLKNKPWKQSEMMTNEVKFQEELVIAFITMMGAFYISGITPENLYVLYFKKNQINLFRQKSNY